MKYQFNNDWREWIHLNTSRGCDKDELVKILLENDFSPQTIIDEMKYTPVSAELIDLCNQKIATQVFTPLLSHQANEIHLKATDGIQTNNQASVSRINVYEAIDNVHLPFAQKIDTDKVHMYIVDSFLTQNECNEVIKQIQKQSSSSTITTLTEADEFSHDLNRRIADYMGIEPERSEKIQGQCLHTGEIVKPYTDYFEANSEEQEQDAKMKGQRTWTFMVFLNDVPEGGQIEFTELELSFVPKKGQALIWNNIHRNGEINRNTMHQTSPILKGERYTIKKLFRTHGSLTNHFVPFHDDLIPTFTQRGFKTTSLSTKLLEKIDKFYHTNRVSALDEKTAAIGFFIHSKEKRSPSKMVELNAELRTEISQALSHMLEKWSGHKLNSMSVFGIREYQQGASLDMHIDRYQTHIMGVIINVDQDVNCDWPLYIYDHYSRLHKVILKPGDVIFYESAKIGHGRPEALDGKRYANIFAHTKPVDWTQKSEQLSQQLQAKNVQQRMKFTIGTDLNVKD